MDLAVNSQVQSPLVRTLSSVPTKSSSFTHNIPDNIPPVSFTRIENTAYNNATALGNTWQFRIPQYGYLQETYLKFSFTFTSAANIGGVNPGSVAWAKEDLSSLCTKLIKTVTLQTHNKKIQGLYGREIYARVLRLPADERKTWLRAMTGVSTSNYQSAPTYMSPILNVAALVTNVEMLIPIPLASTVAPHVNYSTRFVEDLEMWVETSNADIFNLGFALAGTTPTAPTVTNPTFKLVTIFRNFHDVTEQTIRNENFQRGVPASILQYDTDEEAAVAVAQGVTDETKIPIKSNHYAYGFTVLMLNDVKTHAHVTGPTIFPSEVALWASGQKIWGSTVQELTAPIKRDFNLSTVSDYPQGYPIVTDTTSVDYVGDAITGAITQNGRRSDRNIFYIRLGLQHNELMNSGGLALQSLNNPELVFTWPVATNEDIKIHVLTHYLSIVRIDPDNGVITRSIDV